jgi:hypothetical protein
MLGALGVLRPASDRRFRPHLWEDPIVAGISARYLVSGYEILKQGNAWSFQEPFCDNRPVGIEFGDDVFVLGNLDLGNGYGVRTSAAIAGGSPNLLYWLDKAGSPFSDGLLGVTKGEMDGVKLPAGATGAPFPYWFFYANIQTDLKVWIRFMEPTTAGGPRADLVRRDQEERQGRSVR